MIAKRDVILERKPKLNAILIIQSLRQSELKSYTCTMRLGGGMFPGRELKLTPTPPSWWAANLGSSSSSREMRERVPVIVAGLQVLTSLKMTGGRRGRQEKQWRQPEKDGRREVREQVVG